MSLIVRLTRAPAPGWAGGGLMNRTGNDWEPAIATDPDDPWVHVAYNSRGGPDACGDYPDPAMILERSDDGGLTWLRERYLCECRGDGNDGEMAITSLGTTVAVGGEGTSHYGPGGVWSNREQA